MLECWPTRVYKVLQPSSDQAMEFPYLMSGNAFIEHFDKTFNHPCSQQSHYYYYLCSILWPKRKPSTFATC